MGDDAGLADLVVLVLEELSSLAPASGRRFRLREATFSVPFAADRLAAGVFAADELLTPDQVRARVPLLPAGAVIDRSALAALAEPERQRLELRLDLIRVTGAGRSRSAAALPERRGQTGMASLNEILGALLRDITDARIKSDLFTRMASEEYRKDPVMRLLPVPRADIRQASIEVSFAIEKVAPAEVKGADVIGDVLRRAVPSLTQRLAGLELRPSARAEIQPLGDVLGARLGALGPAIAKTDAPDATRLGALLESDPVKFVSEVHSWLASAALAGIRDVDDRIVIPQSTRKQLDEVLVPFVADLRREALEAIRRRKELGLVLDLAATRSELADAPPSVLAKVSLIVELENYEWLGSEEEGGERLTLR